MNKLFSGRFIFTVVTALVFAWASYTKMLTAEQVAGIILVVVTFYFNRQDRGKE